MFSLVHVLLPFSDAPPAEAIAASLARFRLGGRGDVPDHWLRFHDLTADLRKTHEATFTFTAGQTFGIKGLHSWPLDTDAVRAEMTRRGRERWTVRFADVEPDLARFAARFARGLERHPATGGFGHWSNGVGRWDWWDLGGRFDGRITGNERRNGHTSAAISSGPSRGRAALEGIMRALEEAVGQEPPPEIDVRADDNVELVSRLLADLRAGLDGAVPLAILLPPGSADDELRWLGGWPEPGPTEAVTALGCPPAAAWRDVVEAAYARFPDHWAAGVAFHH